MTAFASDFVQMYSFNKLVEPEHEQDIGQGSNITTISSPGRICLHLTVTGKTR
jgi:hypothetical protein